MRNYVITIMDNKKSVAAADRCIHSGKKTGGCVVEKWPATTPRNNLSSIIINENIEPKGLIEKYSRPDNATAAFLSHFSLWKHCIDINEEITILEHDAVFTNNVNSFIPHKGCLSLGHPSYGVYNKPERFGVNPLTSKVYFPGAHAYRIKPNAAKIIIEQAKIFARPTDVFLNIESFPFLEEYYPWPVQAQDSFTTIQNKLGCQAKHNWSERYELINA